MHSERLARRLRPLAVVGLALLPALAHAQLTRGIVSGTVTDSSSAVLPGATITITNEATGIVRTAISSEQGLYRVPALEPGTYTILIELTGFQSVENRRVPIRPAEEVTVNAALAVASLAETVEVTAESSSVTLGKSNPTLGLTASGRTITELPLPGGRNINNAAYMAPNVFRAPGSTEISVAGNRARNNNFMIDGSDNNDVSVTLSTTPVVPEAVAEFQIQTNSYNAEFGRNTGGQINVITKSGTNTLHGDLFNYYQGSDLNALKNTEKSAGFKDPPRSNRNQFGGGVGGPIVSNRLFFYGLVQGDKARRASVLGATIRIPTPAGFAALSSVPLGAGQTSASRQAVLSQLGFLSDLYATNPTYRNLVTTPVNGVGIETAQVQFGRTRPTDTWNTIARVDFQATSNDNMNLRYIMNKPLDPNLTSNTQFGSLFAAKQDIFDQNTSFSYTRIFTPTLLNEARMSYIRRNLQFPENDPSSPTGTITGFFTIGGLSNFPQGRIQDSYQFSNVMTNQRGRHAIKAGADIRYIVLDNVSAFDSKGTFTFNNLQDYMNNLAVTFAQALQTSSFEAKQWQTAWFVQDDFKATPNLTFNLGLRYELSTVPLGFFGAEDAESLAGLVPGPVKQDRNNWAPRLGFAYSPSPQSGFLRTLFGDGNGVVRGGYGIGYDVLFYNILTVNGSNYPRVVVGRLDNAQNVYPNIVPVSGSAVFNPLATYVNSPEDLESPMTHFWSLSMQRQFAGRYTLEVGYTGNIGRNGINQLQANPGTLTEAQAATVRQTGSTTSIPAVQARRDFPQFGSRLLIASTAKSGYHSAFASLKRRFTRGLEFGVSYTIGRLMSNNDESLGVGDITDGSPQVPQDYKNIDAEWSVSAFDRTHRIAVSWIYEVPRMENRLIDGVLGGWQVSGIYQGQSGQPFTIQTGVDSNGNGGGGDRPNFDPNGTLTPDPDTGNLKTFTTSNMFLVPRGSNGLPLAFSLGNGNLGRNTLRAAPFFNWDISLSKRFRITGSHAFQLRADFLNAFNQDNYGLPIANMNNLSFGQNTRDWGNRTMQLSAKYSF